MLFQGDICDKLEMQVDVVCVLAIVWKWMLIGICKNLIIEYESSE